MPKIDRNWNDSVLRVMYAKLPKAEIIEELISIINTACKKDKDLKSLTHKIVTYVQAREIMLGKKKLEDYPEPYRSELKKEVESVGMVL